MRRFISSFRAIRPWCFASLVFACSGSEPSDSGLDSGTRDGAPVDSNIADMGVVPGSEIGDGVRRESKMRLGLSVDTYTWTDSVGRSRSVSLKRQGEGNPGNGGYAIEMAYDVPDGASFRTVTATQNPAADGGFGYFVAHERYRSFDDGTQGTIASLHGEDDSPLSSQFAAVAASRSTIAAASTSATHTFSFTYPKWGTVAAMADADAPTPKANAAHRRFDLPVSVQWTFAKGSDFPRIDFRIDMSAAPAGTLAFDVRGPYGVLEFADSDQGAALSNVQWGDSGHHFTTQSPTNAFLTTGGAWTWNEAIGNSRKYQSLLAKHSGTNVLYELGLFEFPLNGEAGLTYGGYSDHRGSTSVVSGHGFLSNEFQGWEWPFQSAQYSGVSAANPTTGKKFAWGSASLYGAQNNTVYLNATTPVPIVAYPNNGILTYRVCLVLGQSPFTDANRKSLTRNQAESASPSCPLVSPLQ